MYDLADMIVCETFTDLDKPSRALLGTEDSLIRRSDPSDSLAPRRRDWIDRLCL